MASGAELPLAAAGTAMAGATILAALLTAAQMLDDIREKEPKSPSPIPSHIRFQMQRYGSGKGDWFSVSEMLAEESRLQLELYRHNVQRATEELCSDNSPYNIKTFLLVKGLNAEVEQIKVWSTEKKRRMKAIVPVVPMALAQAPRGEGSSAADDVESVKIVNHVWKKRNCCKAVQWFCCKLKRRERLTEANVQAVGEESSGLQ
jgi:hypothetical protein